jgi:hypothetical protein
MKVRADAQHSSLAARFSRGDMGAHHRHAGRVELFDDAWERVTQAAKSSASPHLPEAILAIVEGAHRLGRTVCAVEMAERAAQVARRHSHADAEQSALAALERIRSGAPAPPRAHPPDTVRSFAARLLRALT